MRRTLAGISSIITLLVLPSLIAAQELQPPREEGKFRQPDLVDLVEVDRTSRLDVRYATPNNFTGRAVYTEARAFRQRPAVGAGTSPAPTVLPHVARSFNHCSGMGLKNILHTK